MAFIPILNGAQCEIRYTWNGEQVENVIGLAIPTDYDVASFATLAGQIVSAWETYASTVSSNECALRELYFTDLQSSFGSTYSHSIPVPLPGDLSVDSVPNNCSCAISFRTRFRGRSYRGRNYPPGMPETLTDGSRVAQAWRDAWTSFYATVYGAALANGTPMGVISRRENGLPKTIGGITPITTILFVDDVIDSQRRRLPGRGS
jgi:hypothetical protein